MEYNCKYYKQKMQVSYDSGVTWYDVTPMEYQKGDLYEYQSHDCPIPPPHDYSQDYLTFVARENGTFMFSGNSVDYSLDSGSTWTTLASDTSTPTVASGNKIMWKGTLTPVQDNGIGRFRSTAQFDVEGNPMSLLYGDDFSGKTSLSGKDYAFHSLFFNNTNVVSAENMSLLATTLGDACYSYMFNNCISLTKAPQLPATTLADACYFHMFFGCSSLAEAPELPATTLANFCYSGMFQGCTSLTEAPQLNATTLARGCYIWMFIGCTSLTTAPELPATTLADACYQAMFSGCTSLTTTPTVLPAKTLAENCYAWMFEYCTSLTEAPELPATTLASYCYRYMFIGCSQLNYIKCLATNRSASDCTYNWVQGVSSSGTFIKASSASWTRGINGIPSNWTVQNA